MNDMSLLAVVLLVPLSGTVLGAATVFFLKNEINPKVQKLLLGFAAGVMIAASVWSLLIPAIEMAGERSGPAWLPALVGFLMGVGFLLVLDMITPHLHMDHLEPEGPKSSLSRSTMLIFAITLHNLPEGMAVGVVFATAFAGESPGGTAAALALAVGIAIQNIPEGAVISMPLLGAGQGRGKAFCIGALSGVVEPLGAVLTILLAGVLVPALPFVLSFAAGAMIYVVVEELIPQAQAAPHSNIGTVGAALGFALMMVLDVALG